MHEPSLDHIPKAREPLDKALEWIRMPCLKFVGNATWEKMKRRGLTYQPSVAICSLLIGSFVYCIRTSKFGTRAVLHVYSPNDERERIEVYLAVSLLEKRVFRDVEKASQLLKEAFGSEHVHDSRAYYVALARLGTSGGLVDDLIVKKRLQDFSTR
mmetsp:Transcript_14187/g.25818  ORF Transcript_14187/g.25818 Transcript_14187/m.25818 type:complete len:156 (+) Transcript_14187:184-651(+)